MLITKHLSFSYHYPCHGKSANSKPFVDPIAAFSSNLIRRIHPRPLHPTFSPISLPLKIRRLRLQIPTKPAPTLNLPRRGAGGNIRAIIDGKLVGRTEAKPEQPKGSEEVSQPPLNYKIWVLKVLIHCEGCKKKVAKILKKIDGVYKTEFDGNIGKENKVTVTGNVEPEILIKKLAKGGKYAEMWPCQKANNSKNSNDKKKNKEKNKEKQQGEDTQGSEDGNHGGTGGGGSCDNERETVEAEVVQVQDNRGKKNKGGSGAGGSKTPEGVNAVKVNEGDGAPAKSGGGGKGKEVKVEVVKQGKPVNMSGQPAAAEKCFGGDDDEDDSNCEVDKSGGGGRGGGGPSSSGTKKNKKGPKGKANADDSDEVEQCGDAAPPRTGSPPNQGNVPRGPPMPQGPYMLPSGTQGPNFAPALAPAPASAPAPANHMAPHQQMYEYQYPRQNYNGLPLQAMNFNTAYPARSYGASQYAAPLPHAHSYTYASQSVAAESELRSYHSDSYPQYYPSPPEYNSPQQSDSFVMFSDENPNGCSIM
ncbi:hypothetical protein PS1_010373 [Malus domestica]